MKFRIGSKGVAFGAALMLLAGGMAVPASAQQMVCGAAQNAVLQAASGSVEVILNGRQVAAQLGMQLPNGSVVRTGRASQAVVRIDGGRKVVPASSRLRVERNRRQLCLVLEGSARGLSPLAIGAGVAGLVAIGAGVAIAASDNDSSSP